MLFNVQAANTIIYCRRWGETVRFYRDVLALPVRQDRAWFIEFQVTPDSFISIADAARATIRPTGGDGLTLSWRVGAIDEAHRRLAGMSVAVEPIRTLWGARAFFFRDPEGHRLELWAPAG